MTVDEYKEKYLEQIMEANLHWHRSIMYARDIDRLCEQVDQTFLAKYRMIKYQADQMRKLIDEAEAYLIDESARTAIEIKRDAKEAGPYDG